VTGEGLGFRFTEGLGLRGFNSQVRQARVPDLGFRFSGFGFSGKGLGVRFGVEGLGFSGSLVCEVREWDVECRGQG